MSAFAKITPVEAKRNEFTTAGTLNAEFTAVVSNGATSATCGAYFEFGAADHKVLVALYNSDASTAKTATIKAGNGLQARKDITISLAAGKTTFVVLDSGRFKFVSEDATMKALSSATAASQVDPTGKCFITGASTAIKAAVYVLP